MNTQTHKTEPTTPAAVESVSFAGTDLACVHDDETGEIYVSLRRACEGLGIDYRSQYRKLESTHWACMVVMTTHDNSGRLQEMSMVDLDTLGMWLATIHTSRVSEKARPQVEHYQRACVRAIRSHFFDDHQGNGHAEIAHPDPDRLAEREIRHPDGRVIIERYQDTVDSKSRTEPKGLPSPKNSEPAPIEIDVPVEELRRRFHGALTTTLADHHEYVRMASKWRGQYRRKINSSLKTFIGRRRDDWSALDYHNAVYWLLAHYDLDMQWILDPCPEEHQERQ